MKSNYRSGTHKVGYDEFVGWVRCEREVEVLPGLFKTEDKLVAKVLDAKGKPFASETTARRWAKRAKINLILENGREKKGN